jgi:hypothetical protein
MLLQKIQKKKCGIELDDSQKEVLMGHWRTETPNFITTFAEDTKESFPVDSETENVYSYQP